jgi:hypothetical protein
MNSRVALDSQTGKLLWYRQAVPHDLRPGESREGVLMHTQLPGAGLGKFADLQGNAVFAPTRDFAPYAAVYLER